MGMTAVEQYADLSFEDDGRLGVLLMDAGPVNVLSPDLLVAFSAALDRF
jgi:hypothetical protein